MFDTHMAVIDFLEALLGQHGIDYAGQYGEPGYDLPDGKTPLVVLGYYWCRCSDYKDERFPDSPLHGIEVHYPNAFARLEEQGVEFQWNDEWLVEHESDKAYRSTADSYSWKPSLIITEGGDFLTPDDDIETWVEYLANDPHRCLPEHIYNAADLLQAGFKRWPDDETSYENGWHPGQNDDPEAIYDTIVEAEGEDVQVVFVLDSVGQFDLSFSAYVRPVEVEVMV